jgi:ABC-2 type transport system permease protein
MPLVLSVYVGFFSVMNDPHGTLAVVFSMIPLTSPIVMRIPFGTFVANCHFCKFAICDLLFSSLVCSKIYRVGILMYGKKPTWKELYKWLKY